MENKIKELNKKIDDFMPLYLEKKAEGDLEEIGECHQQIQKWLRERNKLSLKKGDAPC